MPKTPDVVLEAGQQLEGFTITRVTPLDELRAVAVEAEHEGSGARLLHLHADDPENLFSVSFPTPPPDDTGVPHILEHAVLAGSKRFPVREPFFEMIKMSMATFINAMTGYDCTYYPVASNVPKDLFNLAEVYFDAVFHPLLTEQTFRREGHHLAPAHPDQPAGDLTINGIVYSEMKGAYSSPESRLFNNLKKGLLPDSVYARDSGGDPDAIPTLTWQGLRDFHAAWYHPSNGHFFVYGNIDTAAYARFLNTRLADFERRIVQPGIERQLPWTEPRRMEDTYPVGPGEPMERNTYLAMEWLTGDALDLPHMLALHLLSLVLVGNEAAPLKKALVDSRLGDDLVHAGDGAVGFESTFGLALKGSDPGQEGAFTDLVLSTLEQVATAPIDSDRIEAAFQQAAYHYLEVKPMFPLHMLTRVTNAWVYGADPLTFLSIGRELEQCRAAVRRDPGFFGRMIREQLLDNPHRLTSVLRPDPAMQEQTDAAFAEQMRAKRAEITDERAEQIAAEAAELDALNAEPNSPQAIATLPQLAPADLPDRLIHIPTASEQVGPVEVLRNDVFANGVNYLVLSFDLTGLPGELWPYLPHYMDALEKMGAGELGYEAVAQRIARSTGGIGAGTEFATNAGDPSRGLRRLLVRLKTLDAHVDDALALLHDLVFAVNPHDRRRLHDVVTQTRAHLRTDMVHNGSQTASLHAARGMTAQDHLGELVNGLPQLALVESLHGAFDTQRADLVDKIEAVRDFVVTGERLAVSFTGSDSAYDRLRATLAGWTEEIAPGEVTDVPVGFSPYETPPREGLAGPIDVSHSAVVMHAPHYSHPDEVLLAVGTHLVGLDYILPEIRFRGNAYGAWCRHNALAGTLMLGSFRDPHIARTLEVFAGTPDYVRAAPWTQADIDRAIIAVTKRDMRPLRPSEATGMALGRALTGVTPDMREARYARLRAVTPAEVKRALLETLQDRINEAAVCVVAGRAKLEEANTEMKGRELAIEDILKS